MSRSKLSHVRLIVVLLNLMLVPISAITAAPVIPTLVSGSSPFAGCTVGSGSDAVNYLNAEVEPYVAVNPVNPQQIIGVWQQDRAGDTGARGMVAGFSSDGGKTWHETPIPFTACAPGGLAYQWTSDPWVSIGPDGTAYATAIAFDKGTYINAIAAAVSRDGGQTWVNIRAIITDDETNRRFNDKPTVIADPTKAGTAYAVWDRVEASYSNPAYFSKTTDGGLTWSTPQIIVPAGSNKQIIRNQLVVNRQTGALYDFFDLVVPPLGIRGPQLGFVKSTDSGATWTEPQIIAVIQPGSVIAPNNGAGIRTGGFVPEPAIDPKTGQLYVVWEDSRFNNGGYAEIALSTSKDGGASWSAPIRVNTPTGKPAFTPMVKVSGDGTVGVTYYDFRNLQAGNTTTLPTDYWFTTSRDGGGSFSGEIHIAGSFDMLSAPNAYGFFVGDYEGLGVAGTTFYPFFVQANAGNTNNPTDVFVVVLQPELERSIEPAE